MFDAGLSFRGSQNALWGQCSVQQWIMAFWRMWQDRERSESMWQIPDTFGRAVWWEHGRWGRQRPGAEKAGGERRTLLPDPGGKGDRWGCYHQGETRSIQVLRKAVIDIIAVHTNIKLVKSLGYIIVSVIILTTFHVLESHDSPLGQVPMSPVSQTGQVKQIKWGEASWMVALESGEAWDWKGGSLPAQPLCFNTVIRSLQRWPMSADICSH